MRGLLPTVLIALLSLLAACDDGLGPDSSEVGSYELVSVNGNALPTAFFSVEVVSASVTLDADGSYRTRSTVRGKDSLGATVTQTESETGTYTRTGNVVRLTSAQGHVTVGTYNGRTITIEEQSVVMVYRRQS
jgi:hypothetical protein